MISKTKPSGVRLLRWAHPMGFGSYLNKHGVPVDKYLRQQGLPTLCDDPNAFVPLKKAWAYWNSVTRHEDPLLGWHVGRACGTHLLSSGFLRTIKHAPTLYQALKLFIQLSGSEASHLRLGICERKEDILFYSHYPDIKGAPGYMVSQAYQIEVYLALVRHFVGSNWLPDEVSIEAPDIPDGLEEHLGVRVVTNRRCAYLTVPRSCLHLRGPTETKAVNIEKPLIHTDRLNYLDSLRMILRAYLADGYVSAPQAASLMDTSERTLHRRLSQHGIGYGAMVDEVRFNTAREFLDDPDLRIIDVARTVGFDDASNFSRMFRRVGGLSPKDYRKTSFV